MDQKDAIDQPDQSKSRKDRAKLIFLAVISVAVVLVYISQQSGAELPDWPGDLPAALAKAKTEDRKVLVFFAADPASTTARNMSTTTLRKNAGHIKSGKFITLLIQGKKTDELFNRYKVTVLPTFLLLDAEGKVLNRRVRFVGEVNFKKGFLDGSDVRL